MKCNKAEMAVMSSTNESNDGDDDESTNDDVSLLWY